MKTKILLLLMALVAFLVAAYFLNQRQLSEVAKLNQISQQADALTAEANALNAQVDEMIAEISIPDVDWKWSKVNGGDWEPSELDLIFMQRNIQPYVEWQASEQGIEAADWVEFVFQYQGRLYGDEKFIFVKGNCYSFEEENLEIEFIEVLDGGPCHFGTKFDPTTKRFYGEVYFNGEA
ncbi:MAG: hypothetical protein AAGD96_33810 [Chloroflexota bacterium]